MRNDPEKASLLAHLWADRRYVAMLGLGFSSEIPFLLVYVTQSAWLSEAKVPIETIGLMSELTIAYKFKFAWAPFLEKYDAPIFSPLLGRRRGWIVVSQIAVMLALAGIAFGDPAQWLVYTVAFSLALGLAGDAGCDDRRMAYHCGSRPQAIGHDSHCGNGIPGRDARRCRRCPFSRRPIWLAFRLSLHVGVHDGWSDFRFRRA